MSPRVRERRVADLPVLVDLLAEQQAGSGYPHRWPLPFPTEQFLARATERRAWVAEHDGEVVGHVAVTDAGDLASRFAPVAGAAQPAMVSALFTGLRARGLGAGGLLLDTAVAWIRAQGDVPALDVIPTHAAALALYRSRGWVEVGTARFAWLAADVPDVLLMALPPYPAAPSRSSSTDS